MTSNASSSYTTASGTSELSQLPFFRSQVLKQENDATPGKEQHSKVRSSVVKSELSPEVKINSFSDISSTTREKKQVDSSDLSQTAHYLAPTKRPFDLAEHDLLRNPPPTVKVHIQSIKQPRALEATLPHSLSGRITMRLPEVIAPAEPELVRSTLKMMNAMIVYAQYECVDECRSRGICVHFSFLLGCRKAPDGLICPSCQAAKIEIPYAAHRICPRHNKRTLSQFTPNLPEDYLPLAHQLQRAFEIFRRACNGDWEDVTTKFSKQAFNPAFGHYENITVVENKGLCNNSDDRVLPSIEANDRETERAHKRQKMPPKETDISQEYSNDKENDVEERSDAAVQAGRGNYGHRVEDGSDAPRASTITGDHVEAHVVVDSDFSPLRSRLGHQNQSSTCFRDCVPALRRQ